MNLKAIGLSTIAIATIAVAAMTLIGARGAGEVTTARGAKGQFHLDLKKATNGSQSRAVGNAGFSTRFDDNGTPTMIHIRLVDLRSFRKDNKKAFAEGRGVMRVVRGRDVRETRGVINIAVEDLRNPAATSGDAKDKFAIRFAAANASNTPYEFGGEVTRGDIFVYERSGN